MKTISRLLMLLLTLAVVFGALTPIAGAAELSEEDAAACDDRFLDRAKPLHRDHHILEGVDQ